MNCDLLTNAGEMQLRVFASDSLAAPRIVKKVCSPLMDSWNSMLALHHDLPPWPPIGPLEWAAALRLELAEPNTINSTP